MPTTQQCPKCKTTRALTATFRVCFVCNEWGCDSCCKDTGVEERNVGDTHFKRLFRCRECARRSG